VQFVGIEAMFSVFCG